MAAWAFLAYGAVCDFLMHRGLLLTVFALLTGPSEDGVGVQRPAHAAFLGVAGLRGPQGYCGVATLASCSLKPAHIRNNGTFNLELVAHCDTPAPLHSFVVASVFTLPSNPAKSPCLRCTA